jgi:hypothetical protein
MRYIVKWNNGFWKTFDTVTYDDVYLHRLRSEAEVAAQRLNSK